MKLADEAVEKISEVLIHLGEASIIGGVGFVVIDSSKWYIGVGGVLLVRVLLSMASFLFINLKRGANKFMENAFYVMLLVFVMATVVFIVLMRQLSKDQDRSKK